MPKLARLFPSYNVFSTLLSDLLRFYVTHSVVLTCTVGSFARFTTSEYDLRRASEGRKRSKYVSHFGVLLYTNVKDEDFYEDVIV